MLRTWTSRSSVVEVSFLALLGAAMATLYLVSSFTVTVLAILVLVAVGGIVRWPELGFLLLFGLIPFSELVSTGSRYVSGVKGVAVVVLLGFLLRWTAQKENRILYRGHNLVVGLFVAAVTMSSLLALNPEYITRRLLQFLGALAVYFLGVNLIRSRAQIRALLWTMVLSGAGSALLGIFLQVFLGRNLLVSQETQQEYFSGGLRLTGGGSYGPNAFALILVCLIPLSLYLFLEERRFWQKALFLGSLFIMVLADVLTYSRASVVTLALIAPYLLFKLRRRVPYRRLVLGLVVLAIVLLPLIPSSFYNRVETLSEGAGDPSIRGRWSYVVVGLHILADHPILGVGLGNFSYAFTLPQYSQYAVVSPKQYAMGSLRGAVSSESRAAHNMYLEVVTETGILGFSIFCLLLFVAWRDLHYLPRHLREKPSDPLGWMSQALEISLLAFLIDSIFLHVEYHQYLWLIIALSAVMGRMARPSRAEVPAA